MKTKAVRVLALGEGKWAQSTVQSLLYRSSSPSSTPVQVFAGVLDPDDYPSMEGLAVVQANMEDKDALLRVLKEGQYHQVYVTVQDNGHAGPLGSCCACLQAIKEAGIKKISIVSARTSAAHDGGHKAAAAEEREQDLPPCLSAAAAKGKAVSLSAPVGEQASAWVRIQRKSILRSWHPIKIRLLQITLPCDDKSSDKSDGSSGRSSTTQYLPNVALREAPVRKDSKRKETPDDSLAKALVISAVDSTRCVSPLDFSTPPLPTPVKFVTPHNSLTLAPTGDCRTGRWLLRFLP